MASKTLIHGSALRTVSFAASALIALLLMPFIIHTVGDRQYGIWALVASYVGYYGLFDFGLSSAVTRHCAGAVAREDSEELQAVFDTAFAIYVAIAALACCVSIVAAYLPRLFLAKADDADVASKVILLLGFSFALSFPLRVFIGTLNAHLRFDITASLEMLTLIVRTVLVIFFLRTGFMVVGLAMATLFSTLLATIAHFLATRRFVRALSVFRWSFTRRIWKSLLTYGWSSFVIQVADLFRFQLDGFVVAAFIGVAAVTHFSIASTLTMYFVNLMGALFGVLAPLFALQQDSNRGASLRQTYLFATRLSILLSTFIAFGLIAWGRPFIIRWLGIAYSDSYPILVVLTAGAMVALWQNPSVQLLYGVSKHHFLAVASLSEGVANLILSIWLARRFGILGVALGTFIPMMIVKLGIQPLFVSRVSGVPITEYLRTVCKTLAIALLALAPGALLSLNFASPDLLHLAALGAVSLVTYAGVVYWLEFTSEDLAVMSKLCFRTKAAIETTA